MDQSQAESLSRQTPRKPLRLLIVMPSWLGDVVMSTPALRLLRESLPGSFIGGLVRPGLDELIAGSGLLDEVHVDRARGVMGPKIVASRIRPRRYDAALLLANSFSIALITRLAFIPRRIGYDRDGRGLLLTDRIRPERENAGVLGKIGVGSFTPVSAVEYYVRAAREVVGEPDRGVGESRSGGVKGSGRKWVNPSSFPPGFPPPAHSPRPAPPAASRSGRSGTARDARWR